MPSAVVVLALLGEKPKRPKAHPFVFSTTGGVRPFSGFSKAKAALDRHINELRKEDGPVRRVVIAGLGLGLCLVHEIDTAAQAKVQKPQKPAINPRIGKIL